MTKQFSALTLICTCALLSGCLQTRTSQKEVDEKQVLRKQVQSLQTMTADVSNRFDQVDGEFRQLNGRIEAVETRQNQLMNERQQQTGGLDQRLRDMEQRLSLYQEAISKLDSQVMDLSNQVASLQAAPRGGEPMGDSAAKAPKEKGNWEVAEESFERKEWEDAILNYEKYRKSSPKGKNYPMATYKIGVSFQELGLADDAKVFYEEVLAKFPKSSAANKASYRLKNLKK